MNIVRKFALIIAFTIFGCANALPIFEDPPLSLDVESAKSAILQGSYGTAIVFLRSAKDSATLKHITVPSVVEELRHFATKRRLVEIESAIVTAYHQLNVGLTLALADEAILIAKEDDVKVSTEILRIKSRTERHYFEPVFYGIPPHLTPRKIFT